MEIYNTTVYDKKVKEQKLRRTSDVMTDTLRDELIKGARDFKTSWVELGQNLFTAWRDKLYHTWGFEKFEDYTEQELGLTKSLSLKLLKTYFFLEDEEPQYLKESFAKERGPEVIPSYEAVNVVRLAKRNKELTKADYLKIKKDVFENGKDVGEVRKDLTALMKERKPVDPEEDREERNVQTVRKFLSAIRTFKKDAQTLKLLPQDLIEEAEDLMKKLQDEIGERSR